MAVRFCKVQRNENQRIFSISVPEVGAFDRKSIINAGAFDWQSWPRGREFDHKNFKSLANARGVAGGRMFKLRFDRCITKMGYTYAFRSCNIWRNNSILISNENRRSWNMDKIYVFNLHFEPPPTSKNVSTELAIASPPPPRPKTYKPLYSPVSASRTWSVNFGSGNLECIQYHKFRVKLH